MTRMLHVAGIVIIAFVCLSSFTDAQQLPAGQLETRPGYPTIAQVHVLNKLPDDFMSVRVFNTEPVPTTVIGVPTVALTTGTAVEARQVRQRWEYRQIVTVNGTDPTTELNSAGADGWEVAGASPSDARHTAWLLKRVR